MTVGTPLHERTAPLNRKQSGASGRATWRRAVRLPAYPRVRRHPPRGRADRRVAALQVRVSGPDAVRLIDRVITRDATKIKPGQVIYTPWCDDHGKVIDDGTIARLDDDSFRWTSAEPHLRWFGSTRGASTSRSRTSASRRRQ